jgi:hypothetical protein
MMRAALTAGRPAVAAAMSTPVLALFGELAGSREPDRPCRIDELTAVARAWLSDPGTRHATSAQGSGG